MGQWICTFSSPSMPNAGVDRTSLPPQRAGKLGLPGGRRCSVATESLQLNSVVQVWSIVTPVVSENKCRKNLNTKNVVHITVSTIKSTTRQKTRNTQLRKKWELLKQAASSSWGLK
ncbi:hypothetical protein ILYODFUR_022342 [Ilyodon furcidens]|uniref:Uncharacterized protein n=1 Tax=Ilyodon furcidens TaxID=33524 RepID=A0ABV0UI61_9TELE